MPDGGRWRIGLLAASALVALALGLAADAAWAARPPKKTTTPAEKTPGKEGGDAAALEVFRLPRNYRNEDGSFNQDAIVAQQKRRLDVINQKLGTKLRMVETAHYLVFSEADGAMTSLFVRWSESLYANLCQQFSIEPRERVWDGKCILILLNARAKFQQFAKDFDEHDASDAGAFFAWETYAPTEPQLVHMAFPLDDRDTRRLQELFAHEGTHAFIQLYKRTVELPLWLHEGLAEYMTVVNDPTLRPEKAAAALQTARSSKSISRVLKAGTDDSLSRQDYSIAYTLVDCLIAAGRSKFKEFILLLKDGKDQEAALQATYGCDRATLEKKWRAYMTANENAFKPGPTTPTRHR